MVAVIVAVAVAVTVAVDVLVPVIVDVGVAVPVAVWVASREFVDVVCGGGGCVEAGFFVGFNTAVCVGGI
jgi:hypothetical protein